METEMGLEREEEEEINTYHRVYAINNEAGPPLIRPLPILTNNLDERKKMSLVKCHRKPKRKGILAISLKMTKREQTAHLRRTNSPRNSNKLNMSRLQLAFSLIVIVKNFDGTAISGQHFHWFDNCSSFIFERDSRKSLVVGRAVLILCH